jgi:hypothetical protein
MKKITKKILLNSEDDLIIIDVEQLPHPGTPGVWYHLLTDDNYYYWNGSGFTNAGGDRPTTKPPNP